MKQMKDKRTQDRPRGIRIRHVITILLGLLLVATIIVVSLLWYRAGRRAIDEGIAIGQSVIGQRIDSHLKRFLAVPHEIIEANAAAFQVVDPAVLGPEGIRALLIEQVRIFEGVSSIYVGSTAGGLIDAGREGADGPLYTIETEGFRSGAFVKHRIDDLGHRMELILSIPDFDARTRPWYVSAVEAGRPTWSEIYILFSAQDLAIAASRPVYDANGDLRLVLSSDIFLSQIDEYLHSLDYGESGIGFIVEHSGLLVASSMAATQVSEQSAGLVERVLARESEAKLIRETTLFLEQEYPELLGISSDRRHELLIDGQRYFLQAQPIRDPYGIDWINVVVMPESDFAGLVRTGTRTTLALLGIALALAFGIGTVLAGRIVRPLESLTAVSNALGQGQAVSMAPAGRIREIQDLSSSFEEMSGQLQSSIENLRMVIEKAPIAVFVANERAEYVDVNPAACRMTGYSSEELLKLGIPGLMREELSADEIELFSQLRSTGSASGETLVYRKDGSELWIQIDAVALDPHRLVAFCVDITERKQNEDRLRHQQKMEALGTMASGVAHEINNPLMGMMSYAELIGGRIGDEDSKQHVRGILQEGERIAHIVRNLLAFSRGDQGVRQSADLRTIVDDSLPLVRNAMLHSNVSIQAELADNVPEIHCSRPQIQQVLINLLMNARDALDKMYPEFDTDKIVQISVDPVDADGSSWVRLTIEDHGAGMSDEVSSLVFDPFFTTGPRNEKTGLGLTISYGIIQEHGGKIRIESTEGEGTTVIVDFPAE